MKKILLLFFVCSLLLSSCWWDWNSSRGIPRKKEWGYKPVFSDNPELYNAKSEAPRAMKYPGKIYTKDNLIFQSDVGHGVHIIDKSDPADLKNIGFIRVIGNSEMSIIGNTMYVNSSTDLVVVDISDWKNVVELKRISNAFKQGAEANGYQPMVPLPERRVYYDCSALYQAGKVQIGWEKDSINYGCYHY